MYIVWAFQGVSISFAPLFLFWAGNDRFPSALKWVVVPLCFAAVYLIPLFYFRLGGAVIKALRNESTDDHRNEGGCQSNARWERGGDYCPDCGAGGMVPGRDGKCTNCGYALIDQIVKDSK